ncbi:hypothetical protein J6590_035212 [Homalodisca vitripennis]|nr:hypothetical protein J6590_035212 [Homalodisca vitripennis]
MYGQVLDRERVTDLGSRNRSTHQDLVNRTDRTYPRARLDPRPEYVVEYKHIYFTLAITFALDLFAPCHAAVDFNFLIRFSKLLKVVGVQQYLVKPTVIDVGKKYPRLWEFNSTWSSPPWLKWARSTLGRVNSLTDPTGSPTDIYILEDLYQIVLLAGCGSSTVPGRVNSLTDPTGSPTEIYILEDLYQIVLLAGCGSSTLIPRSYRFPHEIYILEDLYQMCCWQVVGFTVELILSQILQVPRFFGFFVLLGLWVVGGGVWGWGFLLVVFGFLCCWGCGVHSTWSSHRGDVGKYLGRVNSLTDPTGSPQRSIFWKIFIKLCCWQVVGVQQYLVKPPWLMWARSTLGRVNSLTDPTGSPTEIYILEDLYQIVLLAGCGSSTVPGRVNSLTDPTGSPTEIYILEDLYQIVLLAGCGSSTVPGRVNSLTDPTGSPTEIYILEDLYQIVLLAGCGSSTVPGRVNSLTDPTGSPTEIYILEDLYQIVLLAGCGVQVPVKPTVVGVQQYLVKPTVADVGKKYPRLWEFNSTWSSPPWLMWARSTLGRVVGVQQYLVKPTVADVNENVLSEQLVEESALTEELVKNAGQPLQSAIRQVDGAARWSVAEEIMIPRRDLPTDSGIVEVAGQDSDCPRSRLIARKIT